MTPVGMRAARRRQERHLRLVNPSKTAGTIAVCSGRDTVHIDFALSLLGVQTADTTLTWTRGADIPTARNEIVRNMKGDWVWFIDDDHTFRPDTLARLAGRDVPIVAPVVLTKRPPFRPVFYPHRVATGYIAGSLNDLPTDGSLHEVQAVGAAGMLIHRRVFDALTDPWFEAGKVDGQALGEDLWFCQKARDAGFPVHVDPTVTLGHLAPVSISPVLVGDGWQVGLDIGGRAFTTPPEY